MQPKIPSKISKDVPILGKSQQRFEGSTKQQMFDLLDQLEVGDSFEVADVKLAKYLPNVLIKYRTVEQGTGKQFTTRRSAEDTLRCWRVK